MVQEVLPHLQEFVSVVIVVSWCSAADALAVVAAAASNVVEATAAAVVAAVAVVVVETVVNAVTVALEKQMSVSPARR